MKRPVRWSALWPAPRIRGRGQQATCCRIQAGERLRKELSFYVNSNSGIYDFVPRLCAKSCHEHPLRVLRAVSHDARIIPGKALSSKDLSAAYHFDCSEQISRWDMWELWMTRGGHTAQLGDLQRVRSHLRLRHC